MKSAGFLLESFFYPIIDVKANIKHVVDSEELPTEPKVSIYFNHVDGCRFQMGLSYEVEASEADPYSFSFMLIGVFVVDEDVPESERAKKIALSGPNILYGALRDKIASLTSVSAWPQYNLPPIVFGSEDFVQPTHKPEN